MKSKLTIFKRNGSNDELKLEHCMANSCAEELLNFAKENNIIYFAYEWLMTHNELQHGTKIELIKLYCNDELVGYASIENFEFRTDKTNYYQNVAYKDLGLIHFATSLKHRNKGYASLLSNVFYKDVLTPLLNRHDENSFIIATGRAKPIIERTGIDVNRILPDFYSDSSFVDKVVNTRSSNRKIAA